jgi:hypothetical protein
MDLPIGLQLVTKSSIHIKYVLLQKLYKVLNTSNAELV